MPGRCATHGGCMAILADLMEWWHQPEAVGTVTGRSGTLLFFQFYQLLLQLEILCLCWEMSGAMVQGQTWPVQVRCSHESCTESTWVQVGSALMVGRVWSVWSWSLTVSKKDSIQWYSMFFFGWHSWHSPRNCLHKQCLWKFWTRNGCESKFTILPSHFGVTWLPAPNLDPCPNESIKSFLQFPVIRASFRSRLATDRTDRSQVASFTWMTWVLEHLWTLRNFWMLTLWISTSLCQV